MELEDPQVLQKKLYFLLEQLQNMASELPLYVLGFSIMNRAARFTSYIFIGNIK